MNLTKMRLGRTPNTITGYREFVLQDNDEQTVTFHKNSKIGAIFGSDLFKRWVFDVLLPQLKSENKIRVLVPDLAIETVVNAVSKFYQVDINTILVSAHGRVTENVPRKVAIHLCQELTGSTQKEIAAVFKLDHHCSVGSVTHQIRMRKQQQPELANQLNQIIKNLIKS